MCYAQLPEAIKHVEVASEVCDTMILINKPDLDKINTTFSRLELADSLNIINDNIISELKTKSNKLNQVIEEQNIIIDNKDKQISTIKEHNKEVISDFEKQIKRANRKKVFWESTTGLGVIAIIFLAIF